MYHREIINESLIKLNFHANTKEDVLKEIADIAFNAKRVESAEAYFNGMLERERTSTTGFGGGIAIPHAKIDAILKPTISVIKLREAVDWEAMDDKPVQLIIALAVPANQEGTLHLQLLAKLSENLMEEKFTGSLLSAKTKNEIYQIITSIFE
ncbi:PTS sugar transporter subunit IIA [Thermoactinomyces mirandus]|uniref:PTS sugar transporter subunit IIA n=1 Tax=Thermoactinomyces mirandus TaxID=2756294 RepID=A0A7W2ASU8_9BACL|nr:PTS sugar transporter subunit IIA [Thermoactinomyces mirandus]MBA4603787.1 PTS sugar transporter subunit IIA [Thermoactinomyces mirandus]